ncbi:MAG: hypothetical protein MHM6MM_004527 [Cercozoa sp. M6MM]
MGVSPLDRADIAHTRVRRIWARIILATALLVLGSLLALTALNKAVQSKLEQALDDDIALYHDLLESTEARLVSQSHFVDALYKSDNLTEQRLNAMSIESAYLQNIGMELYESKKSELEQRGANETVIKEHRNAARIQRRMAEQEARFVRNSSLFFEEATSYLIGAVTLGPARTVVNDFVHSQYSTHAQQAQEKHDLRAVVLYVYCSLFVLIFVLLALARRHIGRRKAVLAMELAETKENIKNMLQVDLITVEEAGRVKSSTFDEEKSLVSQTSSITSLTTGSSDSLTEAGLIRKRLERSQRLFCAAFVLASVLVASALATCMTLHVRQDTTSVRDAQTVGWALFGEPASVYYSMEDMHVALAFIGQANGLIAGGASKTTMRQLIDSFTSMNSQHVAASRVAMTLVRQEIVDNEEARTLVDKVMQAPVPGDETAFNDTALTSSVPAIALYQFATSEYGASVANDTPGVPYFTPEEEHEVQARIYADVYLSTRTQVGEELLLISNLTTQEYIDRRERDRDIAQAAQVLSILCCVAYVIAIAFVIVSFRRMEHTARVHFNGDAWDLDRILADDECATLFREFVHAQLCRESLDFCEAMRATHYRVNGMTLHQAAVLFALFVDTSSETSVNVSAALRRRLIAALENDHASEWTATLANVSDSLRCDPIGNPSSHESFIDIVWPRMEGEAGTTSPLLSDTCVRKFDALLHEVEKLVLQNSVVSTPLQQCFSRIDGLG